MAFDAGTAVDPLDYTLKPYVDAEGTVPEPTHDQVEALFAAVRSLAVAAGVEPGASREEAIKALAAIPEEEAKRLGDQTLEALVEFCQGSPTREEIEQLPYRPLNAFLGWLVGQFAGDLGKGDTAASRATPNGAAPST